jgi:hypothetical protein
MTEHDKAADLLRSEQLQKALVDDPSFRELFCKCWPCLVKLIEAILKKKPFPIPAPVEAFLQSLLVAGDLAHDKLCK